MKIEGSEKSVFDALQKSVFEFMNNKKWTNDVFQTDEKIECSILINLTERISNDQFSGTIQVQSRRPVYGSSYNSTIFNHIDEDLNIRYLQFQNLEFSQSNHLSNLTSILAFYAYIIIGLDYDTFSNEGGNPYFQKALTIVNNAQSAKENGWKAFEGTDNRYWLIQNILDEQYSALRTCFYKYHREGMDKMSEDPEKARATITEALEMLKEVHQNKPNSFNMKLFFNAKADEVVNIYSSANTEEKTRIINVLNQINPANSNKYQRILEARH